jgi:PAS domain S-box-containing protein
MDQDLLNSSPTTPLCNGAVESAPASEDGNFRMVADHANDGIIVMMADGRYVYANPEASQITGYSIDEIRAMGMPGLMHPDELPDAWVRLRKRLKGDSFPTPYETAILDKAGRTVAIEVTGIKTRWGREPADLVVFRDITVQKAAQQKVSEQERAFREIAEKIPGAVFQMVLRKDKSFSFLYMSERFQRVFGYDPEAIEGDAALMFKLVPREDLVRNRKIMFESARTLQTYEVEHRTVSPDGHVRWYHVSGTPHRLPNDEILWNGVAIDVTDMKSVEQALQTSRDELESRVRERTEELAASNRELQEVNAALRVLLKKRAADRSELEKKVVYNIRELVLPNLERLKRTSLTRKQALCTELLEFNLAEVVAPITHALSTHGVGLTPAEIQMTNLVKLGRRTKEIAEMLNVSPKTVETHRKSIRRKLGIQNKSVNLRTYLLSLDM